jgi:hypothetical protein
MWTGMEIRMRKFNLFAILTIAWFCTLPIQADTFTFVWADPSVPGTIGNLGTSHTFTINGMSITALVYNDDGSTTGNALYGKNGGGDETGLGTTKDPTGDTEITYNDYVQLDFSNVLKNYTITSATLKINSDTTNGALTEGYAVYGSQADDGTLIKTTNPVSGTIPGAGSTPLTGTGEPNLSIAGLLSTFSVLTVTETTKPSSSGQNQGQPNILIGTLTITATPDTVQSPKAPEPATFGLIGLSLVGLGIFARKARRH